MSPEWLKSLRRPKGYALMTEDEKRLLDAEIERARLAGEDKWLPQSLGQSLIQRAIHVCVSVMLRDRHDTIERLLDHIESLEAESASLRKSRLVKESVDRGIDKIEGVWCGPGELEVYVQLPSKAYFNFIVQSLDSSPRALERYTFLTRTNHKPDHFRRESPIVDPVLGEWFDHFFEVARADGIDLVTFSYDVATETPAIRG